MLLFDVEPRAEDDLAEAIKLQQKTLDDEWKLVQRSTRSPVAIVDLDRGAVLPEELLDRGHGDRVVIL
jgi:hypothetical protein